MSKTKEKVRIKVNLVKDTEKSFLVEFVEGEFQGKKEYMPKTSYNYADGYIETLDGEELSWEAKTKDLRKGNFYYKGNSEIIPIKLDSASNTTSRNPLTAAINQLESVLQTLKTINNVK